MKKILLLIIIILPFFLNSCTSKEQKAKDELDKKLNITWTFLDHAVKQPETELTVPLGFKLGCTEAEFQKHCNKMIKANGGRRDGLNIYINSNDFGVGTKEVRISNFHYFSDPNTETDIVDEISFIFDEYRTVYDQERIQAFKDSISNKFDNSWQTVDFQLELNSKSMDNYYKYWIKGNQVVEFNYEFDFPALSFYNMPKYGTKFFKDDVNRTLRINEDVKKEMERTSSNPKVENSSWDGSVWQVEKYLKKNLKDPDSYEGIEWSSIQKKDENYVVRHKYRAKNSFGGYTIENQIFNIDSNGEVVNCIDAN